MVTGSRLDEMAHKVLDNWIMMKKDSGGYNPAKRRDMNVFNSIKSVASDLLVTQKRGRVAKHNTAVDVEKEHGENDPNRAVLAVYINLDTNASYMEGILKRMESNAKLWNSEGPTMVKDVITDMFHCVPESMRIFWKKMEYDSDKRHELPREAKYVHAHFPYDVSLDFDRLKVEFGDDIKIWSDPDNRERRYCIHLSEIIFPHKRRHNDSSMDDILEQHVHGRSTVLRHLREILAELDASGLVDYDVYSKYGFSAVVKCKDDDSVRAAKLTLQTYLKTAGKHDLTFQFGEFVALNDRVANQVYKLMKEQVNVTMENQNDKLRALVCETFLGNLRGQQQRMPPPPRPLQHYGNLRGQRQRMPPPPRPLQHYGHMPPTQPHITPTSVADSTLSALASTTAPSESARTSISGRTDMSKLEPLWEVILTEKNIGGFKSALNRLNAEHDVVMNATLTELGTGDEKDREMFLEVANTFRKSELDALIKRHTMGILTREFPDWKTSMDVQSRNSLIGFIDSTLRKVEGESRH